MKLIKATYRQMVAEFLSFLKENNALIGYKKAVIKSHKKFFITIEDKINVFSIKPLKQLFLNGEYRELINMAFVWSNTKEGQEYWDRLDRLWRRKTKENKIQLISEKIYE